MATRKRRRKASAGYQAMVRQRWKRTGRTRLRQRSTDEPAAEPKQRKDRSGGLLDFTASPDKHEYYDSLGYPRTSPNLTRRGTSIPLANGATSVLYVVQPGDTLEQIAQTFQIALDTLVAANPEINPTDPIFPGQFVTVPLTEPTIPPQERTLIAYVAQMDLNLTNIAHMFHVPLEELIRVNPQIENADEIFTGQLIWIPTVPDAPASQLPAILYVTQPGDTLGAIALRYNVTREDIVASNPQVLDADEVFPGELLVVPVSGVPAHPVFTRIRYVVQPGDTIESIAAQFQVRLSDLQSLNPLLLAIPGLTLIVPQGVPVPAPPPPGRHDRPCSPPPFGRALELGDDDFAFVPFGHDFTFPFYGERFTGLFVNSNGNVTFGEGDPNFFPSVDAFVEGPPRIAPFWTDLNPATGIVGAGVFVATVVGEKPEDSRVVVTWDRTPYFFTELLNTVQVSLFGDGLIQVCYFSVSDPPDPRRILIGVARGQGEPESNIFRYDVGSNPRRTGNPQEPTPNGNLSQRILRYVFDPEIGNYRLVFSSE